MKNIWQEIKAWFKYSETIFVSRLDVVFGFALAAIAAMDWSPLLALDFKTDFDSGQLYFISALCIGRGVVGEILRRRNATFYTPEDN